MAHQKIASLTLMANLDRNWSSFQLAKSTSPLSVTDNANAPSAGMTKNTCAEICFHIVEKHNIFFCARPPGNWGSGGKVLSARCMLSSQQHREVSTTTCLVKHNTWFRRRALCQARVRCILAFRNPTANCSGPVRFPLENVFSAALLPNNQLYEKSGVRTVV